MQRQNLPPFISYAPIFAAMVPHLPPQSYAALAQTCAGARIRVNMILDNPVVLLNMLGHFSREAAAEFFIVYSDRLLAHVHKLLQGNPQHYPAYALLIMMTEVKQGVADNDMEKIADTLEYLRQNHFPVSIIDSIEFVASMLALPRLPVRHLLHHNSQFYINLKGANLGQENLDDCDLTGACLVSADLTEASVMRAMLAYANLRHARLTYSRFDGTYFRNAIFDDVQEDLGFPNEPVFSNTRYFMLKEPLSKKLLNPYRGNIPEFISLAIADDFIRHSDDDVNHDQQVEILQDAQTHALFADHGDGIIKFISNNIFTIFTNRQRRIAEAIETRKNADNNNVASAVQRNNINS